MQQKRARLYVVSTWHVYVFNDINIIETVLLEIFGPINCIHLLHNELF